MIAPSGVSSNRYVAHRPSCKIPNPHHPSAMREFMGVDDRPYWRDIPSCGSAQRQTGPQRERPRQASLTAHLVGPCRGAKVRKSAHRPRYRMPRRRLFTDSRPLAGAATPPRRQSAMSRISTIVTPTPPMGLRVDASLERISKHPFVLHKVDGRSTLAGMP